MEADMKVIRVGRFCLLAVLAVSAFAVSTASAAEYEIKGLPEVGRCKKVALGQGTYRAGQCIAVAPPGRGSYEWTQVKAADKATFSGSGGETTIATVGHGAIKCINANFTGEYITAKTATVTVQFQGCVNQANVQCQSGNTKSEIQTLPLEAEYGFIRNEVKEGKIIVVVGLDLKPTPPLTELASYECGNPLESAKIEGSVIGKVSPINKMTSVLNFLYYVRKNGEQLPQKFQEGPTDTLTTTFQNGFETTSAPTSLNIKEYIGSNATPLEIKAKETF
jgi:hypothetical protein